MSEYLCNLLVPGAAKSGTSSLHELLDQHPAISMSIRKEPHYFAIDRYFQRGVSYHNSMFRKSEATFFGESSTIYMPCERAIKRATESLKAPKIIFLLRHPVDRCLSHYRWLYRLGYETEAPNIAFEKDSYGFNPDIDWGGNYKSYLQFSNYARYIPLWKSYFGQENVLVLRSEDLKRDHQSVMMKCFNFLGVEAQETHLISTNQTSNVVRAVPPFFLRAFERGTPAQFRKLIGYDRFRNWTLQFMTHESPYTLDEDGRAWLEDKLAEDIGFYETVKCA